MINVSEAIDYDTAGLIVILRNTGEFVNGLWVQEESERHVKAIASAQQPTHNQLKNVKESERGDDMRLFICNKPLRTTDELTGRPADSVVYKGNKYKIVAEGDWSDYGHHTSIGVRFE